MTSYLEFVQFFKAIETAIPAVRQVTVGSDEEELSLQSNAIKYPHLRVDTPSMTFIPKETGVAVRLKARLFLLQNEPTMRPENENLLLSNLLKLLQKVYKHLMDAHDEGEFLMILNDAGGDAVRRWSGDNAFGWGVDVELELEECCDC